MTDQGMERRTVVDVPSAEALAFWAQQTKRLRSEALTALLAGDHIETIVGFIVAYVGEDYEEPDEFPQAGQVADHILRYLAHVIEPLLALPPSAGTVQSNQDGELISRWLQDDDGRILGAVEGALFSVAMDRGRGKKVSDQAEAARVLRVLRRLAAE